jgi:CDP-glucose 4,6-dehydratase
MSFGNFYKNKTILITGHTGFKGSWLALWLKNLGANVIGLSHAPRYEMGVFQKSRLSMKMIDIRGDVLDRKLLSETIMEYKPEIVFHLAAQPLVRLSYERPWETIQNNVMGTLNLLESMRLSDSIKVMINVTSDKCYEDKEWIYGYKETDSLGGRDPYSASKACSEIITNSYLQSYFLSSNERMISSVRSGNVIGGGDWSEDRIIPDCVRAATENKPVKIRNPNAIRPWQHVLEPLSGYLLLAQKIWNSPKEYAGAWNFGPDSSSFITVGELTSKFISYFNGSHIHDEMVTNSKHETKMLNLDVSKANIILHWKPVLNIEQSIELTASWYKKYSNSNVYDICIKQINYYTNQACEQSIPWADTLYED